MDNASKKLFKKSVVGGFKKEDVAAYIEQLSAKHAEEIDAIRAELKASATQNIELKNQIEELNRENREMESRIEALAIKEQECVDLSRELEEVKAELLTVNERKVDVESELEAVKADCEEKAKKLAIYMGKEQEINKSKEHIADLELEALSRARNIENETKARMEEEEAQHRVAMEAQVREFNTYRDMKYREVERLISEISGAYQRTKSAVSGFKTGFKSVVADLAREIDIISEASNAVEQSFIELSEKYQNLDENEEGEN